MGYVTNIEARTLDNRRFREVLYTAPHSQLVVMSLAPGEATGPETHDGTDRFVRIESGRGTAVLDGEEHELAGGSALVIPAGTEHDIVNGSSTDALKLYTLYTPPEYPDGTIHDDEAQAGAYEEKKRG